MRRRTKKAGSVSESIEMIEKNKKFATKTENINDRYHCEESTGQ